MCMTLRLCRSNQTSLRPNETIMQRQYPILLWALFLLLVLFGLLPARSSADRPPAILSVPGQRPVVILMDMQSTTPGDRDASYENEASSDNVVMNSTDAGADSSVPVLLAAMNIVERIRTETNISLGVTVYDSSRPVVETVGLLADLLSAGDTMPTAVITMSSWEVTSAVSPLLQSAGVHHVDIISDDVGDSFREGNTYGIYLYTPERVQATLTLLETLNASFVVATATKDSVIAQREATLFRQLGRQYRHMCVVSSLVQDGVSASTSTPVVFRGEDDEPLQIDDAGDDDVIMVVGDGYEQSVNKTRKAVLWLREKLNATEVGRMLQTNLTESSVTSLNLSLCSSYSLDEDRSSLADHPCQLKHRTFRQMRAVVQALVHVSTDIAKDNGNSEQGTENLSRAKSEFQSLESEVLPPKEVFSLSYYDKGESFESSAIDLPETFTSLPKFLCKRNFTSSCDVNCHLCDVCVPKVTSDQKAMLSSSWDPSSLLIVGLFPVSRSSESHGKTCGVENPEGLEAARWFLATIDNFTDAMPNVSMGGMVLDTCGRKNTAQSIARNIENCYASYTDFSGNSIVVQPSQVIAYVDYRNYGDFDELDKPVIHVNDEEYKMSTESDESSLVLMADVLATLRWLYVKIVIPSDYKYTREAYRIFRSKNVCIAEEIPVDPDNLDSVASSLKSDSTAVLFLTDHPTTLSVLERSASDNSTSVRLRSAFMPWNSKVLNLIPRSFALDVAITLEHRQPDRFEYPRFREAPNPWQGHLEKSFSNQSSRPTQGMSLVPLAVETLVGHLSAAYRTLCAKVTGVCKAMQRSGVVKDTIASSRSRPTFRSLRMNEFDVIAVRRSSKIMIGQTDLQSSLRVNEDSVKDISPSLCPGWCPRCLACSPYPTRAAPQSPVCNTPPFPPSSPSTTAARGVEDRPPFSPLVSIPGDVLIAGVFPVRGPGKESFTCGKPVDAKTELRAEQAFLFALESAKKRYSNLLPDIEVGGLLLDSCSDLATSLLMIGRFESCEVHDVERGSGCDENDTWSSEISPAQVVGYVLQDDFSRASLLRDTVRGLNKMATISSLHNINDDGLASLESPNRLSVDAILNLFSKFEWTHAHILISQDKAFMDMAEYFVDEAGYRGICVVRYLQVIPVGSNLGRLAEVITDPSTFFVPVILFLSRADAVTLFRDREVAGVTRPWVVSMVGDDWLSTVGINIPWGALLVDVQGKVNDDFQVFLEQFSTFAPQPLAPWWQAYLRGRMDCVASASSVSPSSPTDPDSPGTMVCQDNPLVTGPMHPSAAASRVIRGVDSLLHALDARYKTKCPETDGICRNLSSDIVEGRLKLSDASYKYEEGMVGFEGSGNMDVTLSILSYQPGRLVMVGEYRSTGLSVNASLVQFFSSRGQLLPNPHPQIRCPECACINVVTNATHDPLTPSPRPPKLARWRWQRERGVFIREIWSWAVLALVVAGTLTSIVFVVYVGFKVWQGALARRYIGLGLLLLVSLSLLYLSPLPFLFTPSPCVCGLRYLCPSLALGLCLACLLVKLMALQDYRTIGLGGELCGFNQALSVFFIFLVQVSISAQWWVFTIFLCVPFPQVSISAQWWVFNAPFVQQTVDAQDGVAKVACLFSPRDLVLNLSFVVFLVVLCALYSVSVRKEKKNMGEARLLLAGSWAVLLLWLGWLPALLLLPPRYAAVTVCGGVLATASALLFVVFVPKVRMVARLKYDMAKKQAVNNGYSVDTDFLYERPYSLPGTLTSTYSSIRTYPKSIAATNLDSSLSY